MKFCPHCHIEPSWHYASNTTARENRNEPNRNHWVNWFIFAPGCAHAFHFGLKRNLVTRVIPCADQPAIEAEWDAHAEELFAAYTARWTNAERTAFRAKLWPAPLPVMPTELFTNTSHEEEPAF